MNKTNMMALTVALLFVAAAVAAPANADQEERGFSFSTEGLGGVDHPGPGYVEEVCDDQLAVLVADVPGCDFDDHTVGGFGYIILGFVTIDGGNVGPIPYTGDVTAHLTWSGGEVIFTCTWNGGVWTACAPAPGWVFPPVGETFEFDCYSEAGGLGNWGQCYVGHE